MKIKEDSKIYKKRLVLSSISRKVKQIKDAKIRNAQSDNEAIFWGSRTTNQLLMMFLYNKNKDLVFKKFNDWKAENKTVKKGEKAIMVWGQPSAIQKQKEAERKGEDFDPNSEDRSLFPICFLFSNLQVM
ncbi:MAG: ArdC-like ssDNA-binding domain-containing protein [Bacteroidota bacterium]